MTTTPEVADNADTSPPAEFGSEPQVSPVDTERCERYSELSVEGSEGFKCALCMRGAFERKCPTARACMHPSATPVLYRDGWDHSWLVFAGPNRASPCTNGPDPADELKLVLAQEGLTEVDVSCRLGYYVPGLLGADNYWKQVLITPDRSSPRPEAISPAEVEDALYRARARFSEAAANWRRDQHEQPVFGDFDRAAMKNASFEQPTLRVVEDYREWGLGTLQQVRLFVLYSRESSKVFVLDGSYEVSVDDAPLDPLDDMTDFERQQASILVPWLRSLGITSVRFPVRDACLIPDELGGRHWYHVSFADKDAKSPSAHTPSR